MDEVLLTVAEVAKVLGISRISVWKYINKGLISSAKIGRNHRIPASEIISFAKIKQKKVVL